MTESFSVWKQALAAEFNWLQQAYPLDGFSLLPLKVYPGGWEGEAEESGMEGSVIEKETSTGPVFGILLLLPPLGANERQARDLLQKGIVLSDIPLYVLYHEYGHLVQMHETYQAGGIKALQEEKKETERLVEEIKHKDTARAAGSPKTHERYRRLWFEERADAFALTVYKERQGRGKIIKSFTQKEETP